jgi:addiction module HigA family antidote
MELVRFRHKGEAASPRRKRQGRAARDGRQAAQTSVRPRNRRDTWSGSDSFPAWKLHPLKGDLKGLWSLTVTGNWRLIFRYDEQTNTASDIDLIDYH